MAALPKGWSPCFHEASGAWYYYQASTGTTTWEHPLDEIYRGLVEQARAGNKRQMSLGNAASAFTFVSHLFYGHLLLDLLAVVKRKLIFRIFLIAFLIVFLFCFTRYFSSRKRRRLVTIVVTWQCNPLASRQTRENGHIFRFFRKRLAVNIALHGR